MNTDLKPILLVEKNLNDIGLTLAALGEVGRFWAAVNQPTPGSVTPIRS